MKCGLAVLTVDLSPSRRKFLSALLQSLESRSEGWPITLLGAAEEDPDTTGNLIVSAEEILGAASPDDLPAWHLEQLLALFFAATNKADFTLVLPIGSFALEPITPELLLPKGKARTVWETVDHHEDWWANAHALTGRLRESKWEGPTILPAVMSKELARWTLDIVRRETGRDPLSVLIDEARAGRTMSAMSLYATASGSRFTRYHHDSTASKRLPLLSRQVLWSDHTASEFSPARRAADDAGLFTYVQVGSISDTDSILTRLYASLKPHREAIPTRS